MKTNTCSQRQHNFHIPDYHILAFFGNDIPEKGQ
jgi:hypothetical protein